jgi:hypothetical protein
METKDLQATAEHAAPKGDDKALLPPSELTDILGELDALRDRFIEISPNTALSDKDRQRLLGSGVRRYGFIDKVSDIASENGAFIPPYLDLTELKKLIRQIEDLRNISALLQQMLRINTDNLLLTGDEAYRLALMYYNSVKDAYKRRVPGAEALFKILELYFKRSRNASEEPTEPELERDVKALLHGKKEGRIVIENERPAAQGGKHFVSDDVHSGHAAFKETVGAEIKE